MYTILLILTILLGFILMTKGILKQEVAMPLVALVAIILAGAPDGNKAIHEGFSEFSRIAVLFTAVAVPAHMLQRSKLFDWVGMWIGELIGKTFIKTSLSLTLLIPASSLTLVYIMASLFHNTTSILVSSIIIFVICKSYDLKGLPILAGALVASNLGGFSTRWGDTPNIIESAQWGLVHKDFFLEIMPINISALIILIIIVSLWLKKSTKKENIIKINKFKTVYALVKFRNARKDMSLDKRLIFFGMAGLILAIIGPLFFITYELAFSAFAIIISALGDYNEHRSQGLLALGIETYATLASIFVLAQVLTNSHIGISKIFQDLLLRENNVFAITTISYFGTLLTEAASWASAASPIVHSHFPTHLGAWALGSGIFAGSSSLVTAASAGIILTQETKNFPEGYRVTFGSYVIFGILFSFLMLIYYSLILSIFYK